MGANKCCGGTELFLAVLAVIFSPLAVLIHDGVHQRFFINLLLFLLGVLPGALLMKCETLIPFCFNGVDAISILLLGFFHSTSDIWML
jgi:uncharacterized membrane protein YqaE (UPF0057 family)